MYWLQFFYQNMYGWGTSNYKLGASDKKHVMSSFAEKKCRNFVVCMARFHHVCLIATHAYTNAYTNAIHILMIKICELPIKQKMCT